MVISKMVQLVNMIQLVKMMPISKMDKLVSMIQPVEMVKLDNACVTSEIGSNNSSNKPGKDGNIS